MSDLVPGLPPQLFPVAVDCAHVYAHRDSLCSGVEIDNPAGTPTGTGSELDWLAFYSAVTTNSSANMDVTKLLAAYKAALATLKAAVPPNTPRAQMTAEALILASPTDAQMTMTMLAGDHSVDNPTP